MPLVPSLPRKKPGQAIVDCASEEPTPVPGPGGHPCAGETATHLPGHALLKFALRANTFCLPAKFCRSCAAPIALLPSTTENNSSDESLSGFARFQKISAPVMATPPASHPNQKTPQLPGSSPLPPLLPEFPLLPCAPSHRHLRCTLASAPRPNASRKILPPLHQNWQPAH